MFVFAAENARTPRGLMIRERVSTQKYRYSFRAPHVHTAIVTVNETRRARWLQIDTSPGRDRRQILVFPRTDNRIARTQQWISNNLELLFQLENQTFSRPSDRQIFRQIARTIPRKFRFWVVS